MIAQIFSFLLLFLQALLVVTETGFGESSQPLLQAAATYDTSCNFIALSAWMGMHVFIMCMGICSSGWECFRKNWQTVITENINAKAITAKAGGNTSTKHRFQHFADERNG